MQTKMITISLGLTKSTGEHHISRGKRQWWSKSYVFHVNSRISGRRAKSKEGQRALNKLKYTVLV